MGLGAIHDAIKNRMNSPVLGNYILSLILLNWRIPTTLITGNISPSQRIALIEEYMSGDWYKWSFAIAICVTLFYLYLLPLIELLIKWVQIKISVFVFNKNNQLDSIFENENKYGCEVDILGSALKQQLSNTNKLLAEIKNVLDEGHFSSTSGNATDNLASKRRDSIRLIEENNQIINAFNGIFDKMGGSKPLDIANTAFRNRNNKSKAKK